MKNKVYILPLMAAMTLGGITGAIITSSNITKANAATISADTSVSASANNSSTQKSLTPMYAFDRETYEAQKIAELKTKLSSAVSSGKLTQAQADLALKMLTTRNTLHKQEESNETLEQEKTEHANMRNMTQAQRDAERAKQEANLANALGISMDDLNSLHKALKNAGINLGRGHGHRFMKSNPNTN